MAQPELAGGEDLISSLNKMTLDAKYQDLPDSVVAKAKHLILDTMAVIIGGSAMEGIPAVVDLVKERGGKPESFIPFYGGKVPASEAGLAIGPMSRAMDLGDIHEEAGHVSEYILPPLLAAAGLKKKVTGKEFITAFVVGGETLIRIGLAFKGLSIGAPVFGRGRGHCIFGAVAAVAKLLGLSPEELENTQGIARGLTQPHMLANVPSLMVRVHHGFVAQDAINACLLAKRGITGPHRDVLSGPSGYLGFAKWETEPEAITRELGKKWEILELKMKPYPACTCTHTAIEGILDQMKEHRFQAGDIASIDIEESSINWAIACTPMEIKWHPQTANDCQFSLPYVVATAAYDKSIFLNSYAPEARTRKEVRDLMTRISARENKKLPPWAARVKTTLKNGRKYDKEYVYVKGHPRNPFTETELVDKLKKCVPYSAYQLSGTVVDSLIESLLNLEKVEDVVDALLRPLTPE